MLILVTYDVATTTPAGRRRLRRVAITCKNYGLRVQKSVFECLVGPEQWVLLRDALLAIIEHSEDSLRFYPLDDNSRKKIEHHGVNAPLDLEDLLIV